MAEGKQHSLFKNTIVCFFCFSVLCSLNLQKHSHPAFYFITSPNTFLETMSWRCEWHVIVQNIQNQLKMFVLMRMLISMEKEHISDSIGR